MYDKMYEEMLKFLDNIHDLEAVDLLVLCEQLRDELIANSDYVKNNRIKIYDFNRESECLEDLSNIISKIKKRIIAKRIKSIIDRYKNLSESEQLEVINNIDYSICNIENRTKKHN